MQMRIYSRRRSIANWLQTKKPFGNAIKCEKITYEDLANNTKTGIVFFKDFWRRDGEKEKNRTGDHIDFIKKTELTSRYLIENEMFSPISRWASNALNLLDPTTDNDDYYSWAISPYSDSKTILFWEIP